jgi:uncharacterized protein
VGSGYLGTGGIVEACALIAADLTAGYTFSKLDVAGLADNDRVADAPNSPLEAELEALGDARVETFVEASYAVLAENLQTNFPDVILGEVGQLSMAEGLSNAARLSVPVTDADTSRFVKVCFLCM